MFKINLSKYVFSQIVNRALNPYLELSQEKLSNLLQNQLQNQKICSDYVNQLTQITAALSQYSKTTSKVKKALNKCHHILKLIQHDQHDDHYKITYGQLMEIAMKSGSKQQQIMFASMYLEVYAFTISNLPQQLKIYQSLKNSQYKETLQLSQALNYADNKIESLVKFSNLSFKEYINYCRLFLQKISEDEYCDEIKKYMNSEVDIDVYDECILYYMTISITHSNELMRKQNYKINVKKLTNTILSQKDIQPKYVCMALSILEKEQLFHDKIQVELSGWEYEYLIWFCELQFCQPHYKDIIFQEITSQFIPLSIQLSSILAFLHKFQFSPEQSIDLSDWLSKQLSARKPSEICALLEGIHESKLLPFYVKCIDTALEISLGNFEWEEYNTIYYFGFLSNCKSMNMEYVRRYILNGYAALGINRREVPTSSYFYKILSVVDVNEFYASIQ